LQQWRYSGQLKKLIMHTQQKSVLDFCRLPLNGTRYKIINIKDTKGNSTGCKDTETMKQYIIINVEKEN
jgi:hypothetical protein